MTSSTALSGGHGGGAHGNNKIEKMGDYDSSKLVDTGIVSLSPSTLNNLNMFYQTFLQSIRRKLMEEGHPRLKEFAETHLNLEGGDAVRFANKGVVGIGLATVFAVQLGEIASNLYSTMKDYKNLNVSTKHLHSLGGEDDLQFHDAVDEGRRTAQHKINQVFKQRLVNTAVGAVSTIPQLLIWNHENAGKRKAMEKAAEIADMKTKPVEDQAKWLLHQVEGGEVGNVKISGKVLDQALALRRKEYMDGFEAFKKKNETAIKKELEKELLGLEKNPEKISNWRRYSSALSGGRINEEMFDKPDFESKVPSYYYDKDSRYKPKLTEAEWKIAEEKKWREGVSNKRDRLEKIDFKKVLEKEIRARYAREYGAFDETWRQAGNFGMDSSQWGRDGAPKTPLIQDELRAEFKKMVEGDKALSGEHLEKAREKKNDHENNRIVEMMAGAGSGLLRDIAINMVGGSKMDQFKGQQAYDRLLYLEDVFTKAKGNLPEKIPGRKAGKESEDSCGYAEAVHRLFQTHQQDLIHMLEVNGSMRIGGKTLHNGDVAEIGERYYEKMAKVRWSDKEIQALKDEDLNPYEYAVKHISKRLKDGRLTIPDLAALALHANYKIVHDDGKGFGPVAAGTEEAKAKEAIQERLDRLGTRSLSKQVMDEKAVGEALGKFSFSTDELKAAFGPNGLTGDERAFFFTLVNAHMPDPKVLCRVTGLSEKECNDLRNQFQSKFDQMLDAAVSELSEELKKNPKALDAFQVTDAEKRLVSTMADRAHQGGKNITEVVTEKKDLRSLETVVANATLGNDGPGKHGGFWQKVVARSEQPKEKPSHAAGFTKPHGDDRMSSPKDRFDMGLHRDHDRDRGHDRDRDHDRGHDRHEDMHRLPMGGRDRENLEHMLGLDHHGREGGFARSDSSMGSMFKSSDRGKISDRFVGDRGDDRSMATRVGRLAERSHEGRDPWEMR